MKLLALLKKELREAAVWMVLAALVLGLFSLLNLTMANRGHSHNYATSYEGGLSAAGRDQYLQRSSLDDVIGCLLLCSVGLGAVVAVRQYWIPTFTRTWAFTLHRSTPRSLVFTAKFTVAALALALCLGGVWSLLFIEAGAPSRVALPLRMSVYGHGWLFPLLGLLAYAGVALSGLSTAKWYTTKVAGAAFATVIGGFALVQSSRGVAVGLSVAGIAILAVGVARALQSREF